MFASWQDFNKNPLVRSLVLWQIPG